MKCYSELYIGEKNMFYLNQCRNSLMCTVGLNCTTHVTDPKALLRQICHTENQQSVI